MTTTELIERGIGHNCLSDAYDLGKTDAIEEFCKVIKPYIRNINTNEVWAHTDNEKMMFDWITTWKIALYTDIEKLKEKKK